MLDEWSIAVPLVFYYIATQLALNAVMLRAVFECSAGISHAANVVAFHGLPRKVVGRIPLLALMRGLINLQHLEGFAQYLLSLHVCLRAL